MNNEVKRELKRLENLKGNKDKSTSELEKQAQMNVWKRQINISDKFVVDSDKEIAKQLFNDYCDNYEFDSFSDLNTLCDLVYEETLKVGLQKQINQVLSDDKNAYVPDKTIKSLHDIEQRVLDLKEKLGIGRKDKKESDLTALEQLQKRFSKYVHYNRHSYSFVCPDCGQPTLIRRKCDKKHFDVIKHPFFAGRFYYNRNGMELVKQGIISKDVYAFIMQTSVQFVDWCLEHEHEIPDVKDFTKEEFEEFTEKIDYLKKQKIPEKILSEKECND